MTPTSFFLSAALALSAQETTSSPPPDAPPPEPPAAVEEPPPAPPPPAAVEPPPAPPAAPPAPAPLPAVAPEKNDVLDAIKLTPQAQVKVRGELVGDRTLGNAPLQNIVTHRARLGVSATAAERVSVLVQVQDVRAWGSELTAPTLPPDPTAFGVVTDALSLHQGWASIMFDAAEVRAGRQEISLANERLIGALDWAQKARAFDAVRVLSRNMENLSWTGFFSIVRDKEVAPVDDVLLGGAALEWKLDKWLRISPTLVGDADLTIERMRGTLGSRFDGALGGFMYDVELYGQSTSLASDMTYAGLIGLRASYGFDVFSHPRAGLLVDATTGSSDGQGPIVAFDTLFATNHKFYGFEDLFLNLPLHTGGKGLVDTAVTGTLTEGTVSVNAFMHAFFPAAYDGPGSAMYGIEPDLVVSWKPIPQLALEGGAAVFVPIGDALGRGETAAPWGYLQLNGSI